jgi:hypothetical protein
VTEPADFQFHRLVVETPFLRWSGDTLFTIGNASVGFASSIVAEFAEVTASEVGADGPSLEAEVSTQARRGRFIDITAQRSGQIASDQAFSLLGAIAICLGPAAIGKIVVSTPFNRIAGGLEDTVIEVARHHQMSVNIDSSLAGEIPTLLQRFAVDLANHEELGTALRWFEHGLRTESSTDKLLSFFIGIETILTAATGRMGFINPVSTIAADPTITTRLQSLEQQHGRDALERLLKRLGNPNPSIIDRVAFYAQKRSVSPDFQGTFVRLANKRNSIMHGSKKGAGRGDAQSAGRILRELILLEMMADLPRSEARNDHAGESDDTIYL